VKRDIPVIFDRVKSLRSQAEAESSEKLIFSESGLGEHFGARFALGLIEACSVNFQVPPNVIRALLSHVETAELGNDWHEAIKSQSSKALQSIRTEMVHEFVRVFKVQVPQEYFYELAQAELSSARYAEAAICIVNSKLFERFDCHELCLNLIDISRTHECKLLLNELESLRRPVIETLSTPKHAKTASKLLLDYKLDPQSFPSLMTIVARNSSIFFINRVLKNED